MAIFKQGINSNFSTTPPLPQPLNLDSKIINGRVTDIVLSPDHPRYEEVERKIGTIFFDQIPISEGSTAKPYASPLSFNFTTYPLINEIVCLIKTTSNLNPSKSNNTYYYISPVNIWNTPNHNAFPEVNGINSATFIKANLNSPSNPSQTFDEKSNIRLLLPKMGDTTIEGRNGQSIRFSNEEGNPITLIRNGQNRTTPSSGFEPISENVKNDLSSIYLTSEQKIESLSLINENFISYSTPPITPSQFEKPQIILNSDRIVIEAETDSILLSSQKSIGLLSNESVNIESKDVNIHTNNRIRLGSKNATESVLLGDKTYDVLNFIFESLNSICTALETKQIYPGGIPIPDAPINLTAGTLSQAIKTVKEKVLVNIKSNKVKVE